MSLLSSLKPLCPYCGEFSSKVTGTEVYPHLPRLKHLIFYMCEPCDAFVGTHKDTGIPLGTLANKELRELRKLCHQCFDLLWKTGSMSRAAAYNHLAKVMGKSKKDAHIAMFNVEDCKKLLYKVEL